MRANLKKFENDFEKQLNSYFEKMKAGQSVDRIYILITTWLVRCLAVREDDENLAKLHFKEAKKWFDELGKRLFR